MVIINSFRQLCAACLLICGLGSTTFAAWNIWQFSQTSAGSWLVSRSDVEITQALTEISAVLRTSKHVESQLVLELNSAPRDWVVINSLVEILRADDGRLPEDIQSAYDSAKQQDYSVSEYTFECAKCAWDESTCEGANLLICRLPVELTSVGDAQGVWDAGSAYLAGEEFDKVDASLSIVGLGATAMTIASLGSGSPVTVPAKVGVGSLKILRRSGKLPKWASDVLEGAAVNGVNWGKLVNTRSISLEALAQAVNRKAFQPAIDLSKGLGSALKHIGPAQSLIVLERATSLAEFDALVSVARVYGEKTVGYLRTVGKKRLVRATLRFSDEAYGLFVGLVGMMGTLIASSLTGNLSYVRRRLRRKLRG